MGAKKMRACIILPTYNERENIGIILNELQKKFKEMPKYDMHVLVVDDNSPDRTWEVVRSYGKFNPNIHLLLREKKDGLGSAYIEGMLNAINELNSDYVFNMDADMSHDPNLIPHMLNAAKTHDLIIGSRYVRGGGFRNWPWQRKAISRGANLFGSVTLGLRIKDISSGYRCYSSKLIKRINLNRLQCKGYAFLEEILYYCIKAGARVKEIPLVFTDRTKGTTKLNRKEMLHFFSTIVKLRLKHGKA